MASLENGRCPICEMSVEWRSDSSSVRMDCPRCGSWTLFGQANYVADSLADLLEPGTVRERVRRTNLSHILRSRYDRDPRGPNVVTLPDISKWPLDEPFATPPEMTDRLVIWAGEQPVAPNEFAPANWFGLSAILGLAVNRFNPREPLDLLLKDRRLNEWIDSGVIPNQMVNLRLTTAGWHRRSQLLQTHTSMRDAFMAMKFATEIENAFRNCFKPAAKRAGYNLRTVVDGQPAGSIDDQIRVALRTSRFVVADLTFGNQGAYWEAGFAEGLGRPVIYTCRRAEWDAEKTHFDTNHLATIVWDAEGLDEAGRKLTEMIRATLPSEAKLTDG